MTQIMKYSSLLGLILIISLVSESWGAGNYCAVDLDADCVEETEGWCNKACTFLLKEKFAFSLCQRGPPYVGDVKYCRCFYKC
ncbi:hypothetical protein ABFX02_12G118000 [Erythranthe guttata]